MRKDEFRERAGSKSSGKRVNIVYHQGGCHEGGTDLAPHQGVHARGLFRKSTLGEKNKGRGRQDKKKGLESRHALQRHKSTGGKKGGTNPG